MYARWHRSRCQGVLSILFWGEFPRACYELWAGSFGSGCGGGGSSMERTRTPVGTPGWLWVNLAAMGFSLVHTVADAGLFVFGSSSANSEVPQSLITVLIGLLYTWWAWVFARAVRGANSGLVGLMAFDVLWVSLNGVSIIYCLPPCGAVPFFADTVHLGNL